MKYKLFFIAAFVFHFTIINGKTPGEIITEAKIMVLNSFKKKPIPSICATCCALSVVGAYCSYLLHKNKQYHEQKFEDARYQLQIRGIGTYEEKGWLIYRLVNYGKSQDSETQNYLTQLKESYIARHAREWLYSSAIGLTGISTGIPIGFTAWSLIH